MPDSPSEIKTSEIAIPANVPVCPVRGSVIYPTMVQHIDASRSISIAAIEAAMQEEKVILIVSQRDKDIDDPQGGDLYNVGTLCSVLRVRKNADGTVQMLVSAIGRASVSSYTRGDFLRADVELLTSEPGKAVELQALTRELNEKFESLISGGKFLSSEAVQTIQGKEDAGEMADFIAFNMDFKLEDKQAVLELRKVTDRIRRVLSLLDGEAEVMSMQQKIRAQVKEEIDRNQREYYLREQMKVIQKELHGGEDGETDETEELRSKIEALGLAPEVKKEIDRELNRLSRMHPDAAEASVIRTYLTTVMDEEHDLNFLVK